MIERASGFVANELESDDFLKGLGRKSLISKLAYHYGQLNYVHPFREGNGRAQRAFWDRVARDAGWYLDWTGVTGKANDLACRAGSDTQDLTLLIAMFDKIVTSR